MSQIGGLEIFLVFLVILLLFGASRLPKLARSMGQAGKEFKAGLKEGHVEESVAGACPFCSTDVPAEAQFCPGCGKSATDIIAERGKQKKSA